MNFALGNIAPILLCKRPSKVDMSLRMATGVGFIFPQNEFFKSPTESANFKKFSICEKLLYDSSGMGKEKSVHLLCGRSFLRGSLCILSVHSMVTGGTLVEKGGCCCEKRKVPPYRTVL